MRASRSALERSFLDSGAPASSLAARFCCATYLRTPSRRPGPIRRAVAAAWGLAAIRARAVAALRSTRTVAASRSARAVAGPAAVRPHGCRGVPGHSCRGVLGQGCRGVPGHGCRGVPGHGCSRPRRRGAVESRRSAAARRLSRLVGRPPPRDAVATRPPRPRRRARVELLDVLRLHLDARRLAAQHRVLSGGAGADLVPRAVAPV